MLEGWPMAPPLPESQPGDGERRGKAADTFPYRRSRRPGGAAAKPKGRPMAPPSPELPPSDGERRGKAVEAFPYRENQASSCRLVRSRRCANRLAKPGPSAAAPTGAGVASSGVRPASGGQPCHHPIIITAGERGRGGEERTKGKGRRWWPALGRSSVAGQAAEKGWR